MNDLTSKRGIRVAEVSAGSQEIQLDRDPEADRMYDLCIETPAESETIYLQTPEAAGWMRDYADLLARATSVTLMPRHLGLPVVTVKLYDGRSLVYFRRVRGCIQGNHLAETVEHHIGWEKEGRSSVLVITQEGSVTLN